VVLSHPPSPLAVRRGPTPRLPAASGRQRVVRSPVRFSRRETDPCLRHHRRRRRQTDLPLACGAPSARRRRSDQILPRPAELHQHAIHQRRHILRHQADSSIYHRPPGTMTRAQTDISRSPGKSLISLFPASVSSPHCLKINAPAHTMAHPGSIAVSFRQHPASAHHAVADSSPPHSTNGGRAELPLWTTMQTASTRDE